MTCITASLIAAALGAVALPAAAQQVGEGQPSTTSRTATAPPMQPVAATPGSDSVGTWPAANAAGEGAAPMAARRSATVAMPGRPGATGLGR